MLLTNEDVRLTVKEQTELTDSEKLIGFYRDNPCIAIEELFNVRLTWFQRIAVRQFWKKKFSLFLFSRGLSKTFLGAVILCLRGVLYPGTKLGIIAPSYRQTYFLLDYVDELLDGSAYLRNSVTTRNVVRTNMRSILKFKNGSFIESLPLGDGCVSPSTIITYENQFSTIDRYHTDKGNKIIKTNTKIYGNGKFNNSDESYYNGKSKTLKLKTKRGYEIEGTLNHRIKCLVDNEIVWKRFDEISLKDSVLIDCSYRWHNGDLEKDVDKCYCIGLLIGDSGYTREGVIRFATKDQELINSLNRFSGLKFLDCNDGVHFNCYGKKIYREFLDYWEIDPNKCYTIDKSIPPRILKSSRESMKAFLQGLYDSDGHVAVRPDGTIKVGFTNTSQLLIRQIQFILLHYGIYSGLYSRIRKEGWNRIYELQITGIDVKTFASEIGFRLKRKSDKLQDAVLHKKKWLSYSKRINNGTTAIDKIISIIPSESETFDCHVPDGNEYGANGFFSHNSKIRGRRYHIVLIDEYAQIDDQVVRLVILPMMNIKRKDIENKLVICSTAWWTFGHFYSTYVSYRYFEAQNNSSYGVCEFDIDDLLMTKDSPYQLDMDIINRMRDDPNMTTEEFMMENYCKFPTESHGFITPLLIRQSTPSALEYTIKTVNGVETLIEGSPVELFREEGFTYVAGVDVARSAQGDNFAITVIKIDNGKYRVVNCFADKGLSFQLMLNIIRMYIVDFNLSSVYMDASGGGAALKDLLMQHWVDERTGINHLPIIDAEDKTLKSISGLKILYLKNFTQAFISLMYHTVKANMQHGTLLFPIDIRRDPDIAMERVCHNLIQLKQEFVTLRAESSGPYTKFTVSSKQKKDRATSAGLAVLAANEYLVAENIEQSSVKTLATGMWAE